MNIHNPVRYPDESQEAYRLRQKVSKTERLGINLLWDSAKLGTYDPENKIGIRFKNTYKKD